MKTVVVVLTVLFLFLVLIIAVLALALPADSPYRPPGSQPPPTPPTEPVPPPPSSGDRRIVQTGRMVTFNTDLCTEGVIPTCFGQNPASPYTSPRWMVADQIQSGDSDLTKENILFGTFTLSPTQAFVLSGLTPPQCAYFAFTFYLFSTADCPDKAVFASQADSTNLTAFGDQPFNKRFNLIYTSNLALGDALRKELARNGTETLFVPIPARPLATDTYVVVGRTAGFVDPNQGAAYQLNTRQATAIYDGGSAYANGPFQHKAIWKPRGSGGTDEHITPGQPALDAVFDRAEASVGKTFNVQTWTDVPTELFLSSLPYDTGDDCIRGCAECLGDNRDTAVYRIAKLPNFGAQEVALVVGVNHNRFHNSTYTNFSVVDTDTQFGIASVDTFTTDQVWTVMLVARFPVTLDQCTPDVRALKPYIVLIPSNVVNFSIVERAYLQPGTTLGANTSVLLPFECARGTSGGGGGSVSPCPDPPASCGNPYDLVYITTNTAVTPFYASNMTRGATVEDVS